MRVFHLIYDKRLRLKLFVVLSDYAQLDGHKDGPTDNGNKTLPESLKLPKKIPKTAQESNRKWFFNKQCLFTAKLFLRRRNFTRIISVHPWQILFLFLALKSSDCETMHILEPCDHIKTWAHNVFKTPLQIAFWRKKLPIFSANQQYLSSVNSSWLSLTSQWKIVVLTFILI